MTSTSSSLRIDPDRFRRDFLALAEIGSTGDGGVNRPALSEEHLQARAWFRERIESGGLEFSIDSAGNHCARLPSGRTSTKTLLIGSHLDSVPFGGRFDGALGVLAGLEVLRTVRDAGIDLPVHLEAIDFTDEEGTLVGLLGSRALAGSLVREDFVDPRGGRERLLKGLERSGLTENGLLQARRDPATLAGFMEVHIEQGPRLLETGSKIGIVNTLVGIGSIRLTFLGRADHAGTTPMDTRLDSGQGAARFILAARTLVIDDYPGCVVNVGRIAFEPGALNIVPAMAVLMVEFRSPEEAQLRTLRQDLLDLAQRSAREFGLGVQSEDLGTIPTTPCSPVIQRAFQQACDGLGLRSMVIDSGAGHDAMALAAVCPAGMIFIPSSGGSHSPAEYAEWDDCVNGANVLLQAVLAFLQDS